MIHIKQSDAVYQNFGSNGEKWLWTAAAGDIRIRLIVKPTTFPGGALQTVVSIGDVLLYKKESASNIDLEWPDMSYALLEHGILCEPPDDLSASLTLPSLDISPNGPY